MKCAKEGCDAEAEVIPGLEIYPPLAVMQHYGKEAPLTRMMVNLPVCRACCAALTFKDIVTRDQFLPICSFIESSSGTAVDVEGTKLVPVEFDDPEYVAMKAQQATEAAAPPAAEALPAG